LFGRIRTKDIVLGIFKQTKYVYTRQFLLFRKLTNNKKSIQQKTREREREKAEEYQQQKERFTNMRKVCSMNSKILCVIKFEILMR